MWLALLSLLHSLYQPCKSSHGGLLLLVGGKKKKILKKTKTMFTSNLQEAHFNSNAHLRNCNEGKTFSWSVHITKTARETRSYDLGGCHLVDPEKKQVYLGWVDKSRRGWVDYTLLSIVGLWVSSMTYPLVVGSLSVLNRSQAFPVCLQSPLKALKPPRALHWWPAHIFQSRPSTPQLQKETITSCGPISIYRLSQHDLIRIHRYLWCGVVAIHMNHINIKYLIDTEG